MSDQPSFKIDWIDGGREPRHPPNPEYPDGVDIAIGQFEAGMKVCRVELPYPAKRCGYYVIVCQSCGLRAGVTTAGRPDDPRSVILPCLPPSR